MNGRNSISFISFVLLFAVPSWAGQLVIIASTSPDHPAGGMIEDGTNVTLATGMELSLVSESGQVIMLKGPHSGAVAAAAGDGDKNLTAALAKLVAPQGGGTSKLGVMRGSAKADRRMSGISMWDAPAPIVSAPARFRHCGGRIPRKRARCL